MIYKLGPRAQRVYQTLHARLGAMRPGMQLPPISKLVEEFGVAPLTIRQVVATLEEEGYVSHEQGRGTFVLERAIPLVLVVDDELSERVLLAAHVTRLGHRVVEAAGAAAGLAVLDSAPSIACVFSDIRMPLPEDGIAFIRALRQRRPLVPLAAVTGYPDDLTPLHGTPDYPVLIIPKPVWAPYIEQALRLIMPGSADKLCEAGPPARHAGLKSPSSAAGAANR
jgi:CheY-like chemotaxis protein